MPRSLTRLGDPRIHVGDTGVLLNEVVQFTRNRRLTSLLASLEQGTALLFVPRHVLGEMETDLAPYAADRGVDPATTVRQWRDLYLPRIRVVDVPDTWAAEDQRVRAVVARHATDAPTARLAVTLAPCYCFVQDGDLTANGLGNANWLPLAHASANLAQMELFADLPRLPTILTWELLKAGGRGLTRLPLPVQVAVGVIGSGLVYRWSKSDRATQQLDRVRRAVGKVSAVAISIIGILAERHQHAQQTWAAHQVTPARHRSVEERIARVLALGPSQGMLAGEVARQVETNGNLKRRTAAVRELLRTAPAFTEITRGRWQLGERAGAWSGRVPETAIHDWIRRAHPSLVPKEHSDIHSG